MLEVTGACKSFGGQTVFSDFDLTVEPGQFKVLVGPSGCGKSTLFDGLTGVTALDRGQTAWNGGAVPDLLSHAAYMQQKDLLLPWFTLMENSLLPVRTGKRTVDPRADRETAAGLFRRLGLEGFEHHYPGQVSGGMRQRCALVRTLMFQRDLILLDEPLSAVDAITRRGLQRLLLMLQSDFNKTILMITHDVEEALLLGDEICLLGPRPMAMIDTFVPDRPKPRDFNDPALLALKARILDLLQGDTNEPV